MDDPIGQGVTPPYLVVCHTRPEAFVPLTRNILSRLGYALLSVDEWKESRVYASREPHLRLADESRLDEIPRSGPGTQKILLLTGRNGVQSADSRIVGAIHKPAGLHELYRLLQQELSSTPRSAPRLLTELEAKVRRDGREWTASVRSLSENGCLLRSEEPLQLGAHLELHFGLPGAGWIATQAASTYELPPDTGLVFESIGPDLRAAIAHFVEQGLAAPLRA